ncbi:L,D-transpeptidase [Akkermansiaceae bacterium]|nr:L,D-transpeptidase [Akkermansiaceae bacterium]
MNSSSRLLALPLSLVGAFVFSSCGTTSIPTDPTKPEEIAKAENPHPAGSYEAFKWKTYPGTTLTWKSESLLATANATNTNVKIDIGDQRGFLMVRDQVAMDYRVSTGRRNKYDTPTGKFRITEKIKDKRSNLYGKVLDADGKVVKSNADSRKDEVPEGGKFLGTPMLHWMRLTNDGIGMHRGNVNSRFASHGCIRSHYSAVPIVFAKTRIGTPVTVQP